MALHRWGLVAKLAGANKGGDRSGEGHHVKLF